MEGQVPGRGTTIPHAMGQLSPHAAAREACALQWEIPQASAKTDTAKEIDILKRKKLMHTD